MTTPFSVSGVTTHVVQHGHAAGEEKKSRMVSSLNTTSNTDSTAAGRTKDLQLDSLEILNNAIDELSAYAATALSRRQLGHQNQGSVAVDNYELLEDDPHGKIDTLWQVLQVSETEKFSRFLRELKTLFPDISDQVVVLRQMLRKKEISKTEQELIEQALADIEDGANPKHLQSGINVALKARLYGKALGLSPTVIRQSYRDFLESDQLEHEIYLQWVMLFGAARRQMIIDFMERALMADMNAAHPGCNQREFGDLLGRLTQIKVIRSSDEIFIVSAAADRFLATFSLSDEQWLLFLLPLLGDAALLNHQLHQPGDGVITRQPAHIRVIAIQKLYRLVKALPVTIFSDSEQQQKLHQHFISLIEQSYKQELAASRR